MTSTHLPARSVTSDPLALLDEVPLSDEEAGYVEAARATNTLRGYRSDWNEFTGWSTLHHYPATMPAAAAQISTYLSELAHAGAKVGTLSRRHIRDGRRCDRRIPLAGPASGPATDEQPVQTERGTDRSSRTTRSSQPSRERRGSPAHNDRTTGRHRPAPPGSGPDTRSARRPTAGRRPTAQRAPHDDGSCSTWLPPGQRGCEGSIGPSGSAPG